METIDLEFSASAGLSAGATLTRAYAGVVGSGDLEVLLEPAANTQNACISVHITTSVRGLQTVWQALLERIVQAHALPAMHIEINDFGATPGVVRLRIEQALELAMAASTATSATAQEPQHV